MWKQFTVNWLTSGRVAFTTQRAKARRSQQLLWPVKFLGYEAIFNLPFRPKGFYSCRSGMGKDNLLIYSREQLVNQRYRILMALVSNRFCKQTVKKARLTAIVPPKPPSSIPLPVHFEQNIKKRAFRRCHSKYALHHLRGWKTLINGNTALFSSLRTVTLKDQLWSERYIA